MKCNPLEKNALFDEPDTSISSTPLYLDKRWQHFRFVACVLSNDCMFKKEEERQEKRIFKIHYRQKRREEASSDKKGRKGNCESREDRMVRVMVSRGLFAGDSFDRVFVDGENSKRFREKRISFSHLSHDTLSAVREIKRVKRIARVHAMPGTFSSDSSYLVSFSLFFVPRPLLLSYTSGSSPARCVLVFLRRF